MIFRTDLADERRDIYKKANQIEDEIDGVECNLEEKNGVRITRVKILNEQGENALNKKKGNYITIDCKKVNNLNEEDENNIVEIISNELSNLIGNLCGKEDEVLVVGLGNENLIADALGSKVIDNIEVTRHIKKYFPEYLRRWRKRN